MILDSRKDTKHLIIGYSLKHKILNMELKSETDARRHYEENTTSRNEDVKDMYTNQPEYKICILVG